MNRFFSKLDLRDIKINPEGSHYPPDGDDEVDVVEQSAVEVDDEPYEDVASVADAVVEDEYGHVATNDPVDEPVAPASQNGHATAEAVASVSTTLPGDDVLKVSARSRPSAVAGAIAGVVREYGRAEVQAIGAGATNQAVKAAAIARDYLLQNGIDIVCVPAFIDITIDDEDRTAMRLLIEPR